MPSIFAHFVHDEQCICCDTYDAIDIGALSKATDDETNIFSELIQAAVKEHAGAFHWFDTAYVSACYFVWKDKGRGRDVMSMKEATFRAQIALARTRGWIDSIHVEFWVDSSVIDSSGTKKEEIEDEGDEEEEDEEEGYVTEEEATEEETEEEEERFLAFIHSQALNM
ncbi:hypothetical protein F4680DRAFT_409638 [Xylaria scruposa]|nr:hypothetical protein F4680DRAFT_409638 [Xylaria scruposa]